MRLSRRSVAMTPEPCDDPSGHHDKNDPCGDRSDVEVQAGPEVVPLLAEPGPEVVPVLADPEILPDLAELAEERLGPVDRRPIDDEDADHEADEGQAPCEDLRQEPDNDPEYGPVHDAPPVLCVEPWWTSPESDNYCCGLSRSSFRPVNEMNARTSRIAPIPSGIARLRMFLLESTNFSHPMAFRIDAVRWRNGSWMDQRATTTRTMAIQTHPGFRTPKGFRLDLR